MLEYILPLLIGGIVVLLFLMAARPAKLGDDETPGVVLSFRWGSGRDNGEDGGGDGGD
jgi:hypothetical protein